MPLLPYLAQLVSEEVQKALKSLRRLRLLLKVLPLPNEVLQVLWSFLASVHSWRRAQCKTPALEPSPK